MPRYHFNVYDGVTSPDHKGTQLAGWQEARAEALRLAGIIFTGHAYRIALGADWRMEVTDEHGLVLFRFDFTVS